MHFKVRVKIGNYHKIYLPKTRQTKVGSNLCREVIEYRKVSLTQKYNKQKAPGQQLFYRFSSGSRVVLRGNRGCQHPRWDELEEKIRVTKVPHMVESLKIFKYMMKAKRKKK